MGLTIVDDKGNTQGVFLENDKGILSIVETPGAAPYICWYVKNKGKTATAASIAFIINENGNLIFQLNENGLAKFVNINELIKDVESLKQEVFKDFA